MTINDAGEQGENSALGEGPDTLKSGESQAAQLWNR